MMDLGHSAPRNMSTRQTRREAVISKVQTALPAALVISDPDSDRLANEQGNKILVAVTRGVRDGQETAELNAVRQEFREDYWIFFLVPGKEMKPEIENAADSVFEALQAALAPATGYQIGTDTDFFNLESEDYVGRVAGGFLYVAVYFTRVFPTT